MSSSQSEATVESLVANWFGDGFYRLHPSLQALHGNGGRLGGTVVLSFGRGVAGALGRRLARRLGIPDVAGMHRMDVEIVHDAAAMAWNRCFDGTHSVRSLFRPEGQWPDGRWIESSGRVELALTVEVADGGWYWRVTGARWRGLTVPLWLVPRSNAYKRIEDGKYRFHVGFSLPLLGDVLSYEGLLELDTR